jgi:dethiobiotin synthetase
MSFFVAGTDTGVGKTEIARALATLLAPVRVLKPVETGCEPGKPLDALALREAGGMGQPLDDVCPFQFRLPAAPLVAAEAEGQVIDFFRILGLAENRAIIVEPAGGLLVPLTRVDGRLVTNLDLAERLALPVVLVGRAGLGTLNHCALSVQALRARGLDVAAVVLNRVCREDDPSVESNPRWVHELTGARVLGPTPFVADPSSRPRMLAPFVDSLVRGQ